MLGSCTNSNKVYDVRLSTLFIGLCLSQQIIIYINKNGTLKIITKFSDYAVPKYLPF